MRFEEMGPLLEALGSDRHHEGLDLPSLASDLGQDENVLHDRIEQLEAAGLVFFGGAGDPPMIPTAGKQYLELGGEVEDGVLHFLPRVVDDLHARAALLAGGTILVDEFRHAINNGTAVEHAAGLVPDAFSEAIDEPLALELFAASVALMARLSAGEPAGCVAEEILAVELMSNAAAWLEMQADKGELPQAVARAAAGELRSVFELFEDDDVLDMFEMGELADAAVAGHSEINYQLGVADQRLAAWFKPFGGTAPTGYLDTNRDDN